MHVLLYTPPPSFFFFFFNDTATTEIYTLSLHDALPISSTAKGTWLLLATPVLLFGLTIRHWAAPMVSWRSEEHTSELQSRLHLVCRLLLEKKKKNIDIRQTSHLHIRHAP